MLSIAAAVLAAALFCWPAGAGRPRLTTLRHSSAVSVGAPAPRRLAPADASLSIPWRAAWASPRGGLVLVALAAAIGALSAGLAGGLAAAMVAGTTSACRRVSNQRRAVATATTGLSDALGILVAELRAGAHPADAVQAAADSHIGVAGDVVRVLATVSAAARLGGDVPAALRSAGPAQLRCWWDRLAGAWSLAHQHGIALADVLDAVRCDTEHRVRFATEVQARLAGPRATAVVLAWLPLLGLALGQAVGAAPLRVLCATAVGHLLLVIGTALACAGVWWSTRLISRAVPA
ncbi:MAG: type II secretion system F family protein [Actinomycetota bacterium]|nr:type II secretion system F family protein [Actinomycetota bacterium]